MSTDNEAIGWDDDVNPAEVQQKKESILLPDGDYPFVIKKVEKGQYNGSSKLPPCGMVTVGMVFTNDFLEESYVTVKFFMVKSCLWKIYEFFTSIGLHKPGTGDVGPIPWHKVDTSCSGRATLTTRSFEGKNGTVTQNDVKKFLAPAITEEY